MGIFNMLRQLTATSDAPTTTDSVELQRWCQYLFEVHTEATLRDWARRLQLFRFFRAYGGHANDGDSLQASFAYASEAQLVAFLASLGVDLVRYEVEPPQAQIGVSYSGTEFMAFPHLINGTRWLRQPGHCEIAGIKVFVWCVRNCVNFSLGSDYSVTETDVIEAEGLEKILAQASLVCVDRPGDSKHYICPKYYPDFFNA